MRGADRQCFLHHLIHHGDVARLNDAAELLVVTRVKHFAVGGGDALDDMRLHGIAAVRKGRIGADQFQHRHFRCAERDGGVWLKL